MLKIRNLVKKYRNKVILDDVSYDFKENNLYVIRGENGTGKSTLVKILTKNIFKTKGFVDDIKISYLPDKYNLPKLISTFNYLYLFTDDKKKVDEYIKKYQIPNKLIMNLSKGNLQKIGIVQILLNDSNCFVFDEPFDGLDDHIKSIFIDDLKRLVLDFKLVILVLHNDLLIEGIKIHNLYIEGGKLYEK